MEMKMKMDGEMESKNIIVIQKSQQLIKEEEEEESKIKRGLHQYKKVYRIIEQKNKSKSRVETDKKIIEIQKKQFNAKMNRKNRIELKNEDQTAFNPSESMGIILGQTTYSTGKHTIKIKIDQFPNINTETNCIHLGVINTKNREKFIEKKKYKGTYYFKTFWENNLLQSFKIKNENGKQYSEKYPKISN